MNLPFRSSRSGSDAETLRVIAGSDLGRNILQQHAAETLDRRRELVKARDKTQAALAVASRKRDTLMTVAEAGVTKARAACHVHEVAAGRADLDLAATAPAAIYDFIMREHMKSQPPGYVTTEYAAELVTAERAASAMTLEALTDTEVADRLATLRKHIARKAPRGGQDLPPAA